MSEETETEVPETLTFAQGRDMLADDLERVGGFFTEAAKECREGDIDAMARNAATLAERERCAKIAEALEDNSDTASCPYDGGAGSLGYASACRDIAERIRGQS